MHAPEDLEELEDDIDIILFTVDFVTWILAAAALGLGLVLLFGGPDRVSAPAWEYVRNTPGSSTSWGSLWCALGTLIAFSRATDTRVSWYTAHVHGVTGTAYFLFGGLFLFSAFESEQASLTAIPTYGLLAAPIHAAVAAAIVLMLRARKRRESVQSRVSVIRSNHEIRPRLAERRKVPRDAPDGASSKRRFR